MELYIVRHGQTNWNKDGKIQGRVDLDMNEEGLLQVNRTAKSLSDIHFDQVYASPLKRAVKTATLISGMEAVTIDERLIEIDFGDLEGIVYKDIHKLEENNLNPIMNNVKNFFMNPEEYTPMNGETYESLLNRVGKFLEEIKDKFTDERVLLVSHATCIHAMLTYIKKSPLKDIWSVSIGNCSVSKVVIENKQYHIVEEGLTF